MLLEKLVINGKTRLQGDVTIGGAKNAAVAILPATLLIDGIYDWLKENWLSLRASVTECETCSELE